MATPEEMQTSMIENLPAKTGRSLDEWMGLVRASGLEKHGQVVGMLKGHGVTHGYANLIAHLAREGSASGGGSVSGGSDGRAADVDPVAGQYAGKEALRPIYDAIMDGVRKFGAEVEVAPKKAYVSLRRNRQFGLLQPSTKTRLDVGLKLADAVTEGRLEPAGSWNSMVTHRVRVTSIEEVDDELVGWLRTAYEEG